MTRALSQHLAGWLFGLTLACAAPPALAVSIFACEPEWGALAGEIAGTEAQVFTATTALQDPHHIEARPSLIARLRGADLLLCSGASLEEGWLPQLLQQAGNPRVQSGQPGHVLAAEGQELLERPAVLDRALGDVHAEGNPHLHLDPRRLRRVARTLAERLAVVDAPQATRYRQRAEVFEARWQELEAQWLRQATPLRGLPVAVLHGNWAYLEDWLGLVRVAVLEPKPGVPPSAGHLATVLQGLKQSPARLVLAAPHEEQRPTQWLAEQAGIRRVLLPYTVGGSPQATDLQTLFAETLRLLLEATR
jgi:zinc/manganese transport system substrate-binding protein